MLEKISLPFTSIKRNRFNMAGNNGISMGILIIHPRMMMSPMMKLTNILEKIKVREIV